MRSETRADKCNNFNTRVTHQVTSLGKNSNSFGLAIAQAQSGPLESRSAMHVEAKLCLPGIPPGFPPGIPHLEAAKLCVPRLLPKFFGVAIPKGLFGPLGCRSAMHVEAKLCVPGIPALL